MKKYLIILLIALSGCDIRIERGSTPPEVESITIHTQPKSCFPQNDDASRISAELKRQGIPHTFNDEEKCIYSETMSPEVMVKATTVVFGVAPPAGLSTSHSNGNEETIQLLEANGITVEKWEYRGSQHISWSYEDHEKAEDLLEYEPWKKKMMAEFRASDSPTPNKASNPTP